MTPRYEADIRPSAPPRIRLNRDDRFFLIALLICSLTYSLTSYLGGSLIITVGPPLATTETAKAIWENGSLTSSHAHRVFEAAQSLSRTTNSDVWQDVFAIDIYGNLVAKHSVISSLIAAPFYGALGTLGFWVCQQLFFVALAYSLYRCIATLSGAALPWTSLAAICFLSPTLTCSYRFGHDLHGVTFLIAGLYLSRCRPWLGGFVLGCAVFVRPSHILVALPLLVAWSEPRHLETTARRALGTLAALTIFFLYNFYLFGSPFTTAYSRLPFWTRGELTLQALSLGFELQEFSHGLGEKFFGSEGLFSRYLTTLTLPCAIWMAFRCDHRHFYRTCLVAAIVNAAYAFSYPMWDASVWPFRFLFPTIFLLLIPFAVFIGQVETRLRKGSKMTT